MAYDKYDDDDSYKRSKSYGDSSRSSHSKDKGSDFSTALISEDGRFFGIKVSEGLASQLRTFSGALLDIARRKGEEYGIPLAENFAKDVLGKSGSEAALFGSKAGNVIGYSIIFGNQIADVARHSYDSVQSLNELNRTVSPLVHSGTGVKKTAALSSNNEVITNARTKIQGVFYQRLLNTVTGSLVALPALLMKVSEQKTAGKDRLEKIAYDEAREKALKGDRTDLIKLMEKDLGVKSAIGGNDLLLVKDSIIAEQRKLYNENFKKFADTNRKEVEKEIAAAFDVKKDNIYEKIIELKRLGVSTERLENPGRYNYRDEGKKTAKDSEAELQAAIDYFTKTNKDSKKRIIDEALKAKYVRQEGAFDHNDLKYYDHGQERRGYGRNEPARTTIKEELEKKFAKFEEDKSKLKLEEKEKSKDKGKGNEIAAGAAGLGAGVAAEVATNMFGGKSLEKFQQPVALDRINHLRNTLLKAKKPGETKVVDMIPGIKSGGGKSENEMGYVQYIHTIFKQHQEDSGYADIGERFSEHFNTARWKDDAILGMDDKDLTAYEVAVKTIAKRIKDGRMDAIALINLVGDPHHKIVKKDGHSFGLGGANEEEVKASVLNLIDEQTAELGAAQNQTAEEINKKLGNFIFSVEDLKKALESKDTDPQERAFIFTVFSDVVGSDETLCNKIGITQARCQELRKESQDHFSEMLDGAVLALADMTEHDPKKLEEHLKLTDKELELIKTVAARIRKSGKHAVDDAKDRTELAAIETVVANASMKLGKTEIADMEGEKPRNFWQRLVSTAKDMKEGMRDKAEEKEHTGKHAHKKEEMDMESDDEPDHKRHSAQTRKHHDAAWSDKVKDSDDLGDLGERGHTSRIKRHGSWEDKAMAHKSHGGDLHTAV